MGEIRPTESSVPILRVREKGNLGKWQRVGGVEAMLVLKPPLTDLE